MYSFSSTVQPHVQVKGQHKSRRGRCEGARSHRHFQKSLHFTRPVHSNVNPHATVRLIGGSRQVKNGGSHRSRCVTPSDFPVNCAAAWSRINKARTHCYNSDWLQTGSFHGSGVLPGPKTISAATTTTSICFLPLSSEGRTNGFHFASFWRDRAFRQSVNFIRKQNERNAHETQKMFCRPSPLKLDQRFQRGPHLKRELILRDHKKREMLCVCSSAMLKSPIGSSLGSQTMM